MNDKLKVAAIILTYKRVDFLKKCYERVSNQTTAVTEIIIVNNFSNDETESFLNEESKLNDRLRVITMSSNLGPAGGFKAGMEKAMEYDFDCLWIMDDDVFPNYDCLELLLKEFDNDTILYPKALNSRGVQSNFPAWAGVLIPTPIVNKIGFPIAELFWWAEDTEYLQYRIQQLHKFKTLIVEPAVIEHVMNRGVKSPSWQYYYKGRNDIYMRIHKKKNNYYKIIRTISVLVYKIFMVEDEKIRKLYLLTLGIYHGLFKKLGITVKP